MGLNHQVPLNIPWLSHAGIYFPDSQFSVDTHADELKNVSLSEINTAFLPAAHTVAGTWQRRVRVISNHEIVKEPGSWITLALYGLICTSRAMFGQVNRACKDLTSSLCCGEVRLCRACKRGEEKSVWMLTAEWFWALSAFVYFILHVKIAAVPFSKKK